MIENVSTQLTVFHCFAHCLLPGRAFASLYALLFLEKEAEIGGRVHACSENGFSNVDELVIKENLTTGDYHDETNSKLSFSGQKSN